jgi:hypothetical protein
MPITPSKAKQVRTETYDRAEYAAHVKQIDAYLSRESPNHRQWYYDIGKVSLPVANRLATDYRSAGWQVEISSDRDGRSLVFEEPRWRAPSGPVGNDRADEVLVDGQSEASRRNGGR